MSAIAELRAALPEGRVSTGDDDRRAHAHDYWALQAIRDVGGRPVAPPACVVFPESTGEVARVLEIADRLRTAIVPFGLGSGVCGAVEPGADAVVVDLSRMAALVRVDGLSLVATVQAGLRGSECERLLGEHGLTLGHFPQSIALSTVGGWVATRASGQLSTRYGNIEDLVLAIEVVLPGGRVVRTFPAPRAATGPSFRVVTRLGQAHVERNTENGQSVPRITAGSTVRVPPSAAPLIARRHLLVHTSSVRGEARTSTSPG